MNCNRPFLSVVFCAFLAYSTSAYASVELKFLELEPGNGVSGIALKNAGASQTVSAGQLLWDVRNESGLPALPLFDSVQDNDLIADNLLTFCIELGQNASTGWHTYAKNDLASAPDPYVSSLPANAHIGAQRAALLDLLADHFWDDAGLSNVNAAAFQLAVWEIVHESTSLAPGNPAPSALDIDKNSVSRGTFYVNMANPMGAILSAVTLANSWLSQLGSLTPNDNLSLIALTNGSYQDQIVQIQIPEPTAFFVWLGLLGVVGLKSRSRV